MQTDWVDAFDVKIVCRRKQIRVRIPSRGELPIQSGIYSWSPMLRSAARARRDLQYSSVWCLAKFVNTWVVSMIDRCKIVFSDDILVYLKTKEEYEVHLRVV